MCVLVRWEIDQFCFIYLCYPPTVGEGVRRPTTLRKEFVARTKKKRCTPPYPYLYQPDSLALGPSERVSSDGVGKWTKIGTQLHRFAMLF